MATPMNQNFYPEGALEFFFFLERIMLYVPYITGSQLSPIFQKHLVLCCYWLNVCVWFLICYLCLGSMTNTL